MIVILSGLSLLLLTKHVTDTSLPELVVYALSNIISAGEGV